MAELTLYPDAPETGDVSKSALAAAKMVINKTAIDSNKAWKTAYQNVVTAVGCAYKKYGLRIDHVKKGEGASERTKYQALLRQIAVLAKVAEVLDSLLP